MNDDETELYMGAYIDNKGQTRVFSPHPDFCSFDKLAEIYSQK